MGDWCKWHCYTNILTFFSTLESTRIPFLRVVEEVRYGTAKLANLLLAQEVDRPWGPATGEVAMMWKDETFGKYVGSKMYQVVQVSACISMYPHFYCQLL